MPPCFAVTQTPFCLVVQVEFRQWVDEVAARPASKCLGQEDA